MKRWFNVFFTTPVMTQIVIKGGRDSTEDSVQAAVYESLENSLGRDNFTINKVEEELDADTIAEFDAADKTVDYSKQN